MTDSFFSIIIPTYNSGAHLSKALSSILAQNFKSLEVIIVDNSSTDNTVELAASFDDSRVRVSVGQDRGAYDAMNKGVNLSKGKWVYFLGSDDELYDNSTLSQVAENISKGNERVYYGSVLVVGNAGWAKDVDIYDGQFSLDKMLFQNICHQAVFYDRSLFYERGLFNQEYRICADFDFNLRVAAVTPLEYMPLTVARFHGGGLSSRRDEPFFEDHPYLIASYFKRSIFQSAFRNGINYIAKARVRLWARGEFGSLFRLLNAALYHNLVRLLKKMAG
jgi:glycosyltransferase involved in cell wall biosynthesis